MISVQKASVLIVGANGIGPSIGWGLLAYPGLPILAILPLVTIVGIRSAWASSRPSG